MKLGFVVLAHDNIFRLRQVVRYLATAGSPIALHVDKKLSDALREMLKYNFSDLKNVYFVDPIACEWGEWSIVEATIRSTKLLLEKHPNIDYIQNISGSCLPILSVNEMEAYLTKQNGKIDYIECFSRKKFNWVESGLSHERSTLYHPFNWKTSRRAFNLNVTIQRLLKINRTAPKNIEITFGSQWWCLSRTTLETIFDNNRFDECVNFFKSTWIPDESFFQTLAGHFSKHISNKSLTYANFDNLGKPFIFYDDHLQTLDKLERFFVRKVWSGSDKLYQHFLNPFKRKQAKVENVENVLSGALEQAKLRATQSRKGLISQFRYPQKSGKIETCQEYHVLIGLDYFKKKIAELYKHSDDTKLLGHIFRRNQVQDNLSSNNHNNPNIPMWRDYSPSQFLIQKIWYAQPHKIAFFANPQQIKKITRNLSHDENCQIYMVQGAWLLALSMRDITNLRRLTALSRIELKRENFLLSKMRKKSAAAQLNVIPIGKVLDRRRDFNIDGVGQLSIQIPQDLVEGMRALHELLKQNEVDLSELEISNEPNPLDMPNVIDIKAYKKSS